jgi:hypothetical protein
MLIQLNTSAAYIETQFSAQSSHTPKTMEGVVASSSSSSSSPINEPAANEHAGEKTTQQPPTKGRILKVPQNTGKTTQ